jgi:hypothetical protein
MDIFIGPAREAYWASLLFQRSSIGAKPFLPWKINAGGGGGYWLDGDHHYDPINTFQRVIKYYKKKGWDHTIFLPQLDAAIQAWRDFAVLAKYPDNNKGGETPGVQAWHTILQGIADHYIEGGFADLDDVRAANILLPLNAPTEESYMHMGLMRENAFRLSMAVDRDRMKLGVHPSVDGYARIALWMIDEICQPESAKHWGVAFKPFMAGLMLWGLIKYWQQYRFDSAKAELVNVIPTEVKRMTSYIYDFAYFKPGTAPGWPHGAVSYIDKGMDGQDMAPIKNIRLEEIIGEARLLRASGPLSDKDDHYKGATLSPDTVGDAFLIDGYDGVNKVFRINPRYYPNYNTFVPGSTFTIKSSMYQVGDGPGPSPDLNHMVAPAFAWAQWHDKVVVGNVERSEDFRRKFHEMFNGGTTAHQEPWGMKQYTQSVFWSVDGLEWSNLADEYGALPPVKPEFTDMVGKEIVPNDLVLYTYNWKLELAVVRQTTKGWCKMQVFYQTSDGTVAQVDVAIQKADLKVLKIENADAFAGPAHIAAKKYRSTFMGT